MFFLKKNLTALSYKKGQTSKSKDTNFKLIRRLFLMEKKIASLVILVSQGADTKRLNTILSDFGEFILGRQGINIRHRNLSIISIIIEANTDIIGAISGKIGRLTNIKVKTAMLKFDKNDFSN